MKNPNKKLQQAQKLCARKIVLLQLAPQTMRFILYAFFLIIIALLSLENIIHASISIILTFSQKTSSILTNILKKIQSATKKIAKKSLHAIIHRPKTIYKKTRRKTIKIPLSSKLKYLLAGIAFSFIFIFFPISGYIFIQDLPAPNQLINRQIPQTTRILDRHGALLAQIYTNQDRTIIPLSHIPKYLQNATIAIEDKNFYSHPGFDLPSIFRAFQSNLSGHPIQGGSTITQQLIKSSLLTSERSFTRKFKELILAFWTEKIYSKKQILEMYLNQVPYGGTAWGIEAASINYFNKPTKNLNLAQSAFLAGITNAPSLYSPYTENPNLWKKRQKEVLQNMVNLKYISPKQADLAYREKLIFKKQQSSINAPHFVNYIKSTLAEKYGLPMLEKGGLTITTSLDLNLQNRVENIIKQEVANHNYLNLTNSAALITNPQNGDILAMIGSHNWHDPEYGNFNVTTSLRQPGSSIKVVTYAAALEKGFTAASIIEDTPITYSNYSTPYRPVNYDNRFHGRVTLRFALANSLNIPAVKTLNQIGIPTMVNYAKKLGINTWGNPEDYGLSLTLGAAEVTMLDMTTVYGALANQGKRIDPNPILKITDPKEKTLEIKTNPAGMPVLQKSTAFILSDILADNNARSMEFGPNSPLNLPGQYVSVKTGTTDDKKDNWTIGYTPEHVVAVWVGNNDNSPMSPSLTSGITGAAPIWHQIMEILLKDKIITRPTPPQEIIQKSCNGKPEYFLKGTENFPPCITPQKYSKKNK